MPLPPEQPEREKHPHVAGAVVRLTDAAVDDLNHLGRRDPQIVRWALKKMLLLERDPQAGEPLLAGLILWRKLVVGDRHWRVAWRVDTDDLGDYYVEVAEVWADGYRKDSTIYEEVRERLEAAGDSPASRSLADVVNQLGKLGRGLSATPAPISPAPVPPWLRDALIHVVRLPKEEVEDMDLKEAEARWEAHITGPGA